MTILISGMAVIDWFKEVHLLLNGCSAVLEMKVRDDRRHAPASLSGRWGSSRSAGTRLAAQSFEKFQASA